MDLTGVQFTLPELVAVLGLSQALLMLVYMVMRARRLDHAGIPCFYFLVLAVAFLGDFSERFIARDFTAYEILMITIWFATVPVSLLVVRQVALVYDLPDRRHALWLLTIPLVPALAHFGQGPINDSLIWARLLAVVMGSLSLLSLWDTRGLLHTLYDHKLSGRERYWLCLSLILLNCGLLVFLAGGLDGEKQARGVLGLALIYVVSTCLFRIYPQAVRLRPETDADGNTLTRIEQGLARRIEQLLAMDKVYQEPTYGRTDLARELQVSETQISRIVNLHFGKTLPQVLNECRVRDAARLLRETDANIRQIAEDVGFNSIASFNRVFKDVMGCNPSDFRLSKPDVT